jgi:hypothetical protein
MNHQTAITIKAATKSTAPAPMPTLAGVERPEVPDDDAPEFEDAAELKPEVVGFPADGALVDSVILVVNVKS